MINNFKSRRSLWKIDTTEIDKAMKIASRIIFKETYNIPLIMLTDSEYPGLNEEAKALGAISVISKNLLTVELFSMIRDSINAYKENCYFAGKL